MVIDFDSSHHQMQFYEHMSWIQVFDIYYSLGVDGISVPLIVSYNYYFGFSNYSGLGCIK